MQKLKPSILLIGNEIGGWGKIIDILKEYCQIFRRERDYKEVFNGLNVTELDLAVIKTSNVKTDDFLLIEGIKSLSPTTIILVVFKDCSIDDMLMLYELNVRGVFKYNYDMQRLAEKIKTFIKAKYQNKEIRQSAYYLIETPLGIKEREVVISNRRHHMIVKEVMDFINGNYKEPLTLNDIAKGSGINKYSLCRIFKKIKGVTCFDYLNNVRVKEAEKILQNEGRGFITNIAFEVGFNNLSHFERVFKKIVGQSPVKYKKMYNINMKDN
jgi:YesN/AraC family two-component response regulator